MNRPRMLAVGLVLTGIVLATAACGGVQNPEGWAGPTVANETIYYFSKRDRLTAATVTAAGAATINWQFPDGDRPDHDGLDFDAVYSTPLEHDGLLYFASYDRRIFALNAENGAVAWQRENAFDGGVSSNLAIAGDRLILTTIEGKVYAFSLADGATAPGWDPNGVDLGPSIYAPPIGTGDAIFAATMSGEVFRLDAATGARSAGWEEPFEAGDAVADLALLGDGLLFVPTLGKTVHVVDTANAALIGTYKTEDWVWSAPAFADNVAYFGDFAGKVYALDITTMQLRSGWAAPYDAGARVKSAPALIGDTLIVATREPEIHFINAATGAGLNQVPIEDSGTVRAPLTVDGDAALIATTKGKLFIANAGTRNVPEIIVAGAAQ